MGASQLAWGAVRGVDGCWQTRSGLVTEKAGERDDNTNHSTYMYNAHT